MRDHLNAYRIPCSAVGATAKRKDDTGRQLFSTNTTKQLEDLFQQEIVIHQVRNSGVPLLQAREPPIALCGRTLIGL